MSYSTRGDGDASVPRPCPCCYRLSLEDFADALNLLDRKHQLDASSPAAAAVVAHGARRGGQKKDTALSASKFFSSCSLCTQSDAAPSSRGASKSGQGKEKQQAAGGVKAKKGGKGACAEPAAAAAAPGGYICMTCAAPLCEECATEHFHEHKPATTGKSKKRAVCGTHCVLLELATTVRAVRASCICLSCNISCGASLAGLYGAGAGVDDGCFAYEEALVQVEGHPCTPSGHLAEHDSDLEDKLMKMSELVLAAAGGTFADVPGSRRRAEAGQEDNEGKRRKKQRKNESSEERALREQQKSSRVRELATANLMGLINMGNTCFFSSTIQCLLRISRLVLTVRSDATAPPGPFTAAFSSFVHRYGNYAEAKSATSLQPRGFLTAISRVNGMFSDYGQHDAHELYSCVVNGLCDEYELAGASEQCPVLEHLGGVMRTTITCRNCGSSSSRDEPFFELSIPLRAVGCKAGGAAHGESGPLRVEECLLAALEAEELSGSNGYACEKCCSLVHGALKRREELERAQRLEAMRAAAAAAAAPSGASDDALYDSSDEDGDEDDTSDAAERGSGGDGGHRPAEEAGATTVADARLSMERALLNSGAGAAAPVDSSHRLSSVNLPAPEATATAGAVTERDARAHQGSDAADLTLVDAILAHEVRRLSHGLVVHLKRFRFNPLRMSWEKDDCRVRFDPTLDLGCLGCTLPSGASIRQEEHEPPKVSNEVQQLCEMFPDSPSSAVAAVLDACKGDMVAAVSMLSAGIELPSATIVSNSTTTRCSKAACEPEAYRLVGVVEHRGTCTGGHYVAYVLDAPSNEWFCCNDSAVSKVAFSEVQRAQPYMLFYENVETAVPTGVRRMLP